jgi:hypothetical protein
MKVKSDLTEAFMQLMVIPLPLPQRQAGGLDLFCDSDQAPR